MVDSLPLPYPSLAAPAFQALSLKAGVVQGSPRSSPVSRYLQREPVATRVVLVKKPATTLILIVCVALKDGEPLSVTRRATRLVLELWAPAQVNKPVAGSRLAPLGAPETR